MEELRLVVDPALGLEAGEIVTAWNADASLRARAEARQQPEAAGAFVDPLLAQGLISFAVSVSGGLTCNLILDFIRARLKARNKDAAVQVERRTLPTGEVLRAVRTDKE